MNNKLFKALLSILTAVAIIVSTNIIMDQLQDRQPGTYYQFQGYYGQEPGTVDVLFVGSSRVHNNVNPAALWQEYGISSYALGINSQQIDTSYYAIKEALKYQRPKVLVLEVSQIVDSDVPTDSVMFLSGIKHNEIFYRAALERRTFRAVMNNALAFPMWHSRYDQLTKETYIEDSFSAYPQTGATGYKGAVEHFYVAPQEPSTEEYELEGAIFSPVAESDMDRIVNLCEKEQIELLLLLTPGANRFENVGIADYAARHGVKYINTSDYYDEIGLDAGADFVDRGHMNSYGSWKTSVFLGNILKNDYSLQDHRGDAKYASWDENLAYHYQKIKNLDMPKITGFGTYLDQFPNENYIVIVSLLDGYDSEYIGQVDALSHVLCNEAVYELGGTWVVDGHTLKYGAFGYYDDAHPYYTEDNNTLGLKRSDVGDGAKTVPANWIFEVGNRTFEVERDGNNRKIMVDGVDYAVSRQYEKSHISTGIEIVVYDKLSEQVVDAVCFDASNGWAATRNVE